MIIDIHAHIMKGQEKKIPDFIKVLDEYNVDKAVVAALPPIWVEEQVAITEETKKSVWYRPGGGFVEAPNDFIAECAKKYPDRLIPFGNFDPMLYRSEKKLERDAKKLGFEGIKLHPPVQGFIPSAPQMVLFARKAAELGLPILFHAGPSPIGRCECSNIKYIEDLAIMVPEVTIILGHGGGYLAPWLAQKHENVYIDTSFSNPDLAVLDIEKTFPNIGHTFIDRNIIKMTGAGKICFASDADPELTHLYKDAMDYVNGFDVSDKEKAMIFGGNAKKIFGL